MADTNDGNKAPENVEQDGATSPVKESKSEFKAPASQEELDKIISARLDRERSKYADYAEVKAAAEEYKKIKDAEKTETERLNEKLAEAQKALEAEKFRSLKSSIQAKHSISDEDADLFLTASDEAGLTRQAEALASRLKAQAEAQAQQDAEQARNALRVPFGDPKAGSKTSNDEALAFFGLK